MWNCLIDTGAMFSVVRSDLVLLDDWLPANHPRTFQTASGDSLPGGQRGVFVNLSFSGVSFRMSLFRCTFLYLFVNA